MIRGPDLEIALKLVAASRKVLAQFRVAEAELGRVEHGQRPHDRGHLYTDEVKRCRPVNFTDSKTQPFHESSPSPWQQRPPSLSRGRRPSLRRR